ncbi:hypothetical protein [Chitinophaga cymbidii]|uniref:DUF5018 domain-containing protein n=1 Tax=Chitinophaga cymbidii TaxID=1096750 RepID=A0A512RDM4_9BACT|nr:hypothetical protein [Chitinophaga cymbidii]GEP93803.1 hypothetical protein CCY01nite_00630 [Chitinophaga cymbidii]
MQRKHILLAFAALLFFAACKKETEHAPYPYHRITSFAVQTNGADSVSGAITADTVIIYWPYHLPLPEQVRPKVTVSENATVSPASGTAVDFATGTKYTVEAQDGGLKDYFLKVIVQQPAIQLYTGFGQSVVFGSDMTYDNSTTLRYVIRDNQQTHYFLVDAENNEAELPVTFYTAGRDSMMRVKVPEKGQIAAGPYRIKVTSGTQSVITENAVLGVVNGWEDRPVVNELSGSMTWKRGETITFEGTQFADMQGARLYSLPDWWTETELGALELVSATATSATYRIPDTLPTGTYTFNDDGPNTMRIQLRISDYFPGYNPVSPKPIYVDVKGSDTIVVTE